MFRQGQLTTDYVIECLRRNGYMYKHGDFLRAWYVGPTATSGEQHRVEFINEDVGGIDHSFVYIKDGLGEF